MADFPLFKMAAVRHLGFLKVGNFNFWSGLEAQCASTCQISQRSVEPFQRWPIFDFSRWRPSAILDFHKLEISPRPFHGQFVVLKLRLAMINPHVKFEMSTIICNEEMKGNAKCKNVRFQPPFGGLRGNLHGSSMARWKARCQLPISDNWIFSLALTTAALLCEICRNRRQTGVGHFERKL